MKRRVFLGSLGAGLAGSGLAGAQGSQIMGNRGATRSTTSSRPTGALDLSALPNFCSHEHWGSIDSIGELPEGYRADVERGAVPKVKTGLFDILLDPYFTGHLGASGVKLDELAGTSKPGGFYEFARQLPAKAWEILQPALRPQELTGTYQCLRRGLLILYGVDISSADSEAITRLDAAIGRSYQQIFHWYRVTMKKVGFSELIRPIHPEFYVRVDSPSAAKEEASFTHTLMRVDPLMELWKRDSPRRDNLARVTQVEPRDAASWRAFIGKLFDLAAQSGALGIKQLQAYTRSLEYLPRQDSEVVWSGDLTADQVRTFQDWVMHECCQQAHDRVWPHQIHVGTHNLTQSSPLPLAPLSRRYPNMKIVMLHCWPFLNEAGWLAKYYPNVYIDTCWQPILNPEFHRQALMTWLNYVPTSKITCGNDATSIEMAVGAALYTREILGEVLSAQSRNLGKRGPDLKAVALDMLHNNMVGIYGVGQSISVAEAESWSPGYYSTRPKTLT